MKIIYKYFAVIPIKAEHPVGSGIVVEYVQGDEVPASDWGRAADNLVELGKIQRVAFNVEDGVDEATPLVTLRENEASHAAPKRKPGRPRKADA